MDNLLCILDTETTGLDPKKNEVIQVAAVVCSPDLKVLGTISFKLHPERPETATKKALEINGYSPRTWKAKFRTHKKAWLHFNKELRKIAGRSKVSMVGQNVKFDYRFMREEYRRAGVKFPFNRDMLDVIDVAKLWCRAAGITLSSYRLENLCRLSGVTNARAHDALADAKATLGVLKWFVRELNRRGKDVRQTYASL